MDTIRIKNLRSFNDTGDIELRKINLLVGENSAGKSTLLRFFPLMKQSILKNTKGPILWYDESLVDFGSYNEAKNRYSAESEPMSFSFTSRMDINKRRYFGFSSVKFKENLIANLTTCISEKNQKVYISEIDINLEDQNIVILINPDNSIETIYINDKLLNIPEKSVIFANIKIQGLIPFFMINKKDNSPFFDLYRKKCLTKITSIIGGVKVNESTKEKILKDVTIGSKNDILNSFKSHELKTWQKKVSNWNVETTDFLELNNDFIAFHLLSILSSFDEIVSSFFREVDYVAPVRAKALRYYRQQDLSVEDIDAYGDNLPMFLDNLTTTEKKSFHSFVSDLFGFSAETKIGFGHITINIRNKNDEAFNLTDLGFGYSQLLPIITKLWNAVYKKKRSNHPFDNNQQDTAIVIEQPELHLHPAMQAQLADAFIKTLEIAKEKNINLKIIVETHSQTIINRIGKHIRDKELTDFATVLLFELDNNLKFSKVSKTEFDEKGRIKNWPLGFFEPKKIQ